MRTNARLKEALLWCVSLLLLGVLAASFHISIDATSAVAQGGAGTVTPSPSPTPRCGWGENCQETTTKSSTLNVDYILDGPETPVGIPNGGVTSWYVELKYQAEWGADCEACEFMVNGQDDVPKATFNVAFNGATGLWAVNTIVADPEFLAIYICASNACLSPLAVPFGTGYTIGIDFPESVTEECPGEGEVTYWIDQVFYKTTAVSAGTPLNGTCGPAGPPVLPVSQTFSAGDNGEFECGAGTCGFGPSLAIQY